MSIFLTTAPYHLLTYSFSFGATVFHSYVSSPVAFKVLPKDQFGKLQNHLFPSYFLGQAISPVIIGLTAPFALSTAALVTLGLSSLGGLANYFWLLPWTHNVKSKRLALQETIGEGFEENEDYKKLTKEFGRSHGLSLLFNLITAIGLASYGVILSGKLLKNLPK